MTVNDSMKAATLGLSVGGKRNHDDNISWRLSNQKVRGRDGDEGEEIRRGSYGETVPLTIDILIDVLHVVHPRLERASSVVESGLTLNRLGAEILRRHDIRDKRT